MRVFGDLTWTLPIDSIYVRFEVAKALGLLCGGPWSCGRAVSVADEVMARVIVGAASSDREESLA